MPNAIETTKRIRGAYETALTLWGDHETAFSEALTAYLDMHPDVSYGDAVDLVRVTVDQLDR